MDYEQTEKDIKKITEIAEKLPEQYRPRSFEVMAKLYANEKLMEMDNRRFAGDKPKKET